jgi:hypothetical protein
MQACSVDAALEGVPLDDASVDTVVTTWTLCTIPDAPRALVELRPGGVLLFVEHGRAPEPGVARWQDGLDPLWRRVGGGCHLNRKIDELVSDSGFRIDTLTNARLPGQPERKGNLGFCSSSCWVSYTKSTPIGSFRQGLPYRFRPKKYSPPQVPRTLSEIMCFPTDRFGCQVSRTWPGGRRSCQKCGPHRPRNACHPNSYVST